MYMYVFVFMSGRLGSIGWRLAVGGSVDTNIKPFERCMCVCVQYACLSEAHTLRSNAVQRRHLCDLWNATKFGRCDSLFSSLHNSYLRWIGLRIASLILYLPRRRQGVIGCRVLSRSRQFFLYARREVVYLILLCYVKSHVCGNSVDSFGEQYLNNGHSHRTFPEPPV